MKIKTLVFLFLIYTVSTAQSDSTFVFEFLPSGLHFIPFKANIIEAKIGILGNLANTELKVDIGNNIDLVEFNFLKENLKVTMGVEFMAYAWSKSYNGARLQIGAVDGFFGGNAVVSYTMENQKWYSRFRIIHNSSHFVDGNWDFKNDYWIDNEKPPYYARDLAEVIFTHEMNPKFGIFRYYTGGSYSMLVRPEHIKRYIFNAGFEAVVVNAFGKVFEKETNLFTAYNLVIAGEPIYKGSNNLMLGTKFGEWFDKGIAVYLSYYSGYNYFHAYYNKSIKQLGLGFLIDFK
ncbi:MAG: hypothetical protein V1720_04620 [bacterium]